MKLDFRTEHKDVEVIGINKYLGIPKEFDIETCESTAYIEYELEPEVRSWGVKYITVFVKKVMVRIEWEIDCYAIPDSDIAKFVEAGGKEYGSEFNHIVSGEIEINCGDGWEIENIIKFSDDGSISINNVIIDLSKQHIELS